MKGSFLILAKPARYTCDEDGVIIVHNVSHVLSQTLFHTCSSLWKCSFTLLNWHDMLILYAGPSTVCNCRRHTWEGWDIHAWETLYSRMQCPPGYPTQGQDIWRDILHSALQCNTVLNWCQTLDHTLLFIELYTTYLLPIIIVRFF